MITRTQAIRLSLGALALGLCVAARAAAPVIGSFSSNGVLLCTNLVPGSAATVEWAPSANGPWTNSWAGLDSVMADSNGTIQVSVPMFYRVRSTNSVTNLVDQLAYLRQNAARVVSVTRTERTGPWTNTYYWPLPGYITEWISDEVMAIETRPDLFSDQDIWDEIRFWNAAKYAAPRDYPTNGIYPASAFSDASTFDAYYYDATYHYVSLVYTYWKKTGSLAGYTAYLGDIEPAINSIPVTNHMVWVSGPYAVGWGWLDTLSYSGYDLATSVLRYRAYDQLSQMAYAAGDPARGASYAAELPLVRKALMDNLWDAAKGFYRNTTATNNNQHNAVGSAMAVLWGACQATNRDAILDALYAAAPGNSNALAGRGLWYAGAMRTLPLDEQWDGCTVNNAYVCGGYWPNLSYYGVSALALKHPATAAQIVEQFYWQALALGTNAMPEWYGPGVIGGSGTSFLDCSVMMSGVSLDGLANRQR